MAIEVHLTIDLNLQNIVENEIDAAMREYTPKTATIILMRPQTGEILAMANRPHFDLNQRSEAKPEQMKNRAIIDMMEPGSTFKIVTAAAALNERKVRPETTIFCENGLWNYGGRPLHDHTGATADLSVRDILVKSSNIGAAKLAISVGEQKFYEYIRRFGFGERTGIELPGEIGGMIRAAAILEQDLDHAHPDGPRSRRHAAANDFRHGDDREWRQTRHSAHRQVDHHARRQDGQHFFAGGSAAGHFAGNGGADRERLARRGERSRHGGRGGGARVSPSAAKRAPRKKWIPKADTSTENTSFPSRVICRPSIRSSSASSCWTTRIPTKPELNYGGLVAGPIFSRIAEKAARYLDLEPHEEVGKPPAAGRVALTNAPRR